MKIVTSKFFVFVTGLVLVAGCKTVQVPKFASVENVMELKINSTLDEVVSRLGSKPYNIYSNQKEGYTIYVYKYKLVERKVNPNLMNSRGGETTGTEVYNGKEQTLYLMFKEGRLESFVTSDGRKDSGPVIKLNNSLYMITSDKGLQEVAPVSSEEPAGNSVLPSLQKKKK